MAGTLTISTLSDGTNSTSSTNCIKGSARAWVSFNGSGGASINSSYNVSSVTYGGTGTYTVNFTTAMPSANYVPLTNTTTSGSGKMVAAISGTPTASAFTFFTSATLAGGAQADSSYAVAGVFSS
jgi:hypothetical protein